MKLDKYPELIAGAYTPSEIFTQDDIKEVIKYAGEVSTLRYRTPTPVV